MYARAGMQDRTVPGLVSISGGRAEEGGNGMREREREGGWEGFCGLGIYSWMDEVV